MAVFHFLGGIDLVFLIDTSSHLTGEKHFQFIKGIVSGVFHSFTLGNGLRYGLAGFGDSFKVNMVFQLLGSKHLYVLSCTSGILFWCGFTFVIVFTSLEVCDELIDTKEI